MYVLLNNLWLPLSHRTEGQEAFLLQLHRLDHQLQLLHRSPLSFLSCSCCWLANTLQDGTRSPKPMPQVLWLSQCLQSLEHQSYTGFQGQTKWAVSSSNSSHTYSADMQSSLCPESLKLSFTVLLALGFIPCLESISLLINTSVFLTVPFPTLCVIPPAALLYPSLLGALEGWPRCTELFCVNGLPVGFGHWVFTRRWFWEEWGWSI